MIVNLSKYLPKTNLAINQALWHPIFVLFSFQPQFNQGAMPAGFPFVQMPQSPNISMVRKLFPFILTWSWNLEGFKLGIVQNVSHYYDCSPWNYTASSLCCTTRHFTTTLVVTKHEATLFPCLRLCVQSITQVWSQDNTHNAEVRLQCKPKTKFYVTSLPKYWWNSV